VVTFADAHNLLVAVDSMLQMACGQQLKPCVLADVMQRRRSYSGAKDMHRYMEVAWYSRKCQTKDDCAESNGTPTARLVPQGVPQAALSRHSSAQFAHGPLVTAAPAASTAPAAPRLSRACPAAALYAPSERRLI
jgi:hypothetical protein